MDMRGRGVKLNAPTVSTRDGESPIVSRVSPIVSRVSSIVREVFPIVSRESSIVNGEFYNERKE